MANAAFVMMPTPSVAVTGAPSAPSVIVCAAVGAKRQEFAVRLTAMTRAAVTSPIFCVAVVAAVTSVPSKAGATMPCVVWPITDTPKFVT